jgi:hypothetical protein
MSSADENRWGPPDVAKFKQVGRDIQKYMLANVKKEDCHDVEAQAMALLMEVIANRDKYRHVSLMNDACTDGRWRIEDIEGFRGDMLAVRKELEAVAPDLVKVSSKEDMVMFGDVFYTRPKSVQNLIQVIVHSNTYVGDTSRKAKLKLRAENGSTRASAALATDDPTAMRQAIQQDADEFRAYLEEQEQIYQANGFALPHRLREKLATIREAELKPANNEGYKQMHMQVDYIAIYISLIIAIGDHITEDPGKAALIITKFCKWILLNSLTSGSGQTHTAMANCDDVLVDNVCHVKDVYALIRPVWSYHNIINLSPFYITRNRILEIGSCCWMIISDRIVGLLKDDLKTCIILEWLWEKYQEAQYHAQSLKNNTGNADSAFQNLVAMMFIRSIMGRRQCTTYAESREAVSNIAMKSPLLTVAQREEIRLLKQARDPSREYVIDY